MSEACYRRQNCPTCQGSGDYSGPCVTCGGTGYALIFDREKATARVAALENALRELAARHEWQPGVGLCVCSAHQHAATLLADR